MDILTEAEIDSIVAKSKLAGKYNQAIDSQSAYEILTEKLEDAAKDAESEQAENTRKRSQPKEKGFFDNTTVKQVGRTAASVITRTLLGVLGLGGRSRRRKLF
jgi:hypothetical protein